MCYSAFGLVARRSCQDCLSIPVLACNIHDCTCAGLALLGNIDEKFVEVTDVFEPNESGQRDKAFISKGYDATSHFETTVEDVLELYTRITGKVLDLASKDPAQA